MDSRPSRPVDTLPHAVRARTILAGSHHAWVQRLECPDADAAPSLVGVVDVAGTPNLLLPPGEALPPGRVRLTCTEVAEEVGVLTVTGELAPGVPAVTVPEIVAALHLGQSCAGDPDEGAWSCPGCPLPELTVMSMEVTGLRVAAAGGGDRSVRAAAVDPEHFRDAAPDRWLLHGEPAVRHLEEGHRSELLAVARAGGLTGVTAVSIRTADADGVVLTCLAPDGLADVVLPFTPPLRDPRELPRRVIRS
jgi:hypothetical protein